MTVKYWKRIVTLLAIGLASVSLSEAGPKKKSPFDRKDTLLQIALDVEDGARHLSWHAERTARPATYRERRALVRLDLVAEEAREFRIALQRYGPMSPRSEREIDELVTALRRAQGSIGDLRTVRGVEWDLRRLDDRTGDLVARFDRINSRAGRYHGGAYPTRVPDRGTHISIGVTWNR